MPRAVSYPLSVFSLREADAEDVMALGLTHAEAKYIAARLLQAPQTACWVDARGAPRRQETGSYCCREQHGDSKPEWLLIEQTHAIKQRAQQPRHAQG